MDSHVTGTFLQPWAEISGDDTEIHLKLHEDYFARTILKKKYFTLNDPTPGVEIDTIFWLNATEATIKLTGSISGNNEMSVTIADKVINTFDDITSNILGASSLIPVDEKQPYISISMANGVLTIGCDEPQLLGESVGIYNTMGQQVATYRISGQNENSIHVNLKTGVYLVRIFYDNKPQTQRIITGF
jgi:hypothetical protein